MKRIRDLMRTPSIADLRNIYDPEDMRELGFEYVGVADRRAATKTDVTHLELLWSPEAPVLSVPTSLRQLAADGAGFASSTTFRPVIGKISTR